MRRINGFGKIFQKIGNDSGEFKDHTAKVTQDELKYFIVKYTENKKQFKLPPRANKQQLEDIRLEHKIQSFGSYWLS